MLPWNVNLLLGKILNFEAIFCSSDPWLLFHLQALRGHGLRQRSSDILLDYATLKLLWRRTLCSPHLKTMQKLCSGWVHQIAWKEGYLLKLLSRWCHRIKRGYLPRVLVPGCLQSARAAGSWSLRFAIVLGSPVSTMSDSPARYNRMVALLALLMGQPGDAPYAIKQHLDGECVVQEVPPKLAPCTC